MQNLKKWVAKGVLLLGIVFIISGCSIGFGGGNSVDKFVAKEIKKYSGLTPNPVNDPAYRLQYSYEIDRGCMIIRIDGDYFEPMKRMLGEMLGESTPTAYEDIIEYALPNDVFL